MVIGVSVLLILVLIFLGLGVPLSFMIGSVYYAIVGHNSVGNFAYNAYYSIGNSPALLAIPLFLAAGAFIEKSGIAKVLIDLGDRMLYKIKGGMTATIPLVSCFFGALCGSGLATASVLSNMMTPPLVEKGWDKRYVAALIAASSPFGYMIPPNMNAILYATITTASVGALFLATVIPGVLWAFLYLVINRLVYQKWYHPEKTGLYAGMSEVEIAAERQKGISTWRIVRSAIPAFIMPVLVLGGIYTGVFTATEAGAVACLYAAIVGVSIYRTFKMSQIPRVFATSAYNVATLMLIIPMTTIFTRILIMNNVPEMVTNFILSVSTNRIVVILIINVVLFIAGFFLDSNILLLVFVPLLQPAALALDISLIQLAVIIFVAIGIGSVTPPMAMCLFAASKTTGVPVVDMVKPILPFILFAAIPIMLAVSFFPQLSEWLPGLIYPSIS